MSVIAIAKKDFRDAMRSRVLIALIVLFALFTVGGAYISTQIAGLLGDAGDQPLDILFALQTPASFLIPIIGLMVGYKAIAGERETGSLKFLLGLPHSRRDVVLGKVLGRTGVVTVAIGIGFAVGIVAIFGFTGSFSLVEYLAFTLVTILLGLTFVSIAVGISAATGSTTRAAVGIVSLIGLFWLLWGFIGQLLLYLITGSIVPEPPVPDWYLLYTVIPPGGGYGLATGAVLPTDGQFGVGMLAGDDVPFFAEPWFGFVILAVWIVVPLALGYWRFSRVDL